jgi:hypothetical protein
MLLACSDARRAQPSKADAGARLTPAPSSSQAPVRAPPHSQEAVRAQPPPAAAPAVEPFRIVERKGIQSSSSIAALGQRLFTGPDGGVVLDLPNGARVHLEPSSRLYVLELEPCALLLISGSVFIELLPQGNQVGRADLRLVTALGSLIVTNTAEVWISQRNWRQVTGATGSVSSQTYLTLLRGIAELARLDSGGELQTEPLTAGQGLATAVLPKARRPLTTVDEARTASVEFMAQRRDPVRLRPQAGRLERALAAVAQEQDVGTVLLSRMAAQRQSAVARVPVLSADAAVLGESTRIGTLAEVRAYQRQLATHAQQKHQLRQVLLLAAEESLLALLAACEAPEAPELVCPGLSDWQTRFAARLEGNLSALPGVHRRTP